MSFKRVASFALFSFAIMHVLLSNGDVIAHTVEDTSHSFFGTRRARVAKMQARAKYVHH